MQHRGGLAALLTDNRDGETSAMSAKLATGAFRGLRTILDLGTVATWPDGRLLEQFRAGPKAAAEAAFEALVSRHGPMVLRVCRGILDDEHDAQDAFQATFLVLVKRADSVRDQSSVASWLYGVAHRVASRARSDAARRRTHERRAAAAEASGPAPEGWEADGHPALVEEVRRLPEKYRSVVVLYYFEGLTQDQVAYQLARPSGTVRARLCRARDLLRGRLARRGLAVPAALLAAGSASRPASASVPPAVPAALAGSTVRAALLAGSGTAGATATVAALAAGASRGMALARVKLAVAATLGLGLVAAGASNLDRLVAPPAVARPEIPPTPAVPPAPAPFDATPGREPSTVARPLAGIVIDGDLGDWPANIERHRIERGNGQGARNRSLADRPEGTAPADFSVGYDPERNLIYLAVVVRDARPVVGQADPWHTDAMEVFLDGRFDPGTTGRVIWKGDMTAEAMPVMQYAGIPAKGGVYGQSDGNPALMYGDVRKTRTTMAWTRRDGVITYEWAIQAFDRYPDRPSRLEPGRRLGFDVAVLDQNLAVTTPDGSAPDYAKLPTYDTWAPWRGGFKGFDASSLGELIVGPP
jgi:RNA polymerase sigma factor (sigma-70 family)